MFCFTAAAAISYSLLVSVIDGSAAVLKTVSLARCAQTTQILQLATEWHPLHLRCLNICCCHCVANVVVHVLVTESVGIRLWLWHIPVVMPVPAIPWHCFQSRVRVCMCVLFVPAICIMGKLIIITMQ